MTEGDKIGAGLHHSAACYLWERTRKGSNGESTTLPTASQWLPVTPAGDENTKTKTKSPITFIGVCYQSREQFACWHLEKADSCLSVGAA